MKIEHMGMFYELSAVKDNVTVRANPEALESLVDALELAGWAERAGEPVSGSKLSLHVVQTLPRTNMERRAIILSDNTVEISRADAALWLGFEVLNYL